MNLFNKKTKQLKEIEEKIDRTDKKVDSLSEKIDRILKENKCRLEKSLKENK